MSVGTNDVLTRRGSCSQQYLTFTLSEQEFGIEILSVQEIRNYSTVTPIPNAPREVRGVINLRGAVVPIVDLKSALGMDASDHDKFSVIIVVNIDSRAVGLIVDAVSDVVDVSPEDVEQTPAMLTQSGNSVVQGIAKSEDRLISLLDLSCVLRLDSMSDNFA